jgi:DNA modification methylase
MSTWQILLGDVREKLAELPAGSVQTCVTSPPYWGLRDYGADGQLGLEPTPDAYVANLVQVFREVKRVLRDDATCWINLGDSYNSGTAAPSKASAAADVGGWTSRSGDAAGSRRIDWPGLKPKDLCGIPWRVAFALQADGWYLRSDIIWSKPNPMPESVTDRPTKAHEYLFLLTKSARYYYDAEAIKDAASWTRENNPDWQTQRAATNSRKGGPSGNRNGSDGGFTAWSAEQGRNKRSVWHIATQAFAGAHFATFPEALIEPCILAGTSEKGQCPACGSPWVRVVDAGESSWERRKADGHAMRAGNTEAKAPQRQGSLSDAADRAAGGFGVPRQAQTIGWQPSCACPVAEPVPQLVLDPFTGSGTTGAVAIRHQRSFVGCELNPAYLELARRRIGDVAPLLAREVA